MKPEDFQQFTDLRVCEVMAAAANLVEECERAYTITAGVGAASGVLKTALFAAQHSAPNILEQGGISFADQEDGWTVITIPDGYDLVCGCGTTLVHTTAPFNYGAVVKPQAPYDAPPRCTSCAALLDRGQDPKKE